jgi:hypothetical protein
MRAVIVSEAPKGIQLIRSTDLMLLSVQGIAIDKRR